MTSPRHIGADAVQTWTFEATTALPARMAPGRTSRHHTINASVARAFAAAGVPVTKEPSSLSKSDGKRLDDMTLIPWKAGKPTVWDITICCTTADSYVAALACEAGAASEMAASTS